MKLHTTIFLIASFAWTALSYAYEIPVTTNKAEDEIICYKQKWTDVASSFKDLKKLELKKKKFVNTMTGAEYNEYEADVEGNKLVIVVKPDQDVYAKKAKSMSAIHRVDYIAANGVDVAEIYPNSRSFRFKPVKRAFNGDRIDAGYAIDCSTKEAWQ